MMTKEQIHEQYKNPPVSPLKRHTARFSTYEDMSAFNERNQLHDFIWIFSYGASLPYMVVWDSEKDRSEFK